MFRSAPSLSNGRMPLSEPAGPLTIDALLRDRTPSLGRFWKGAGVDGAMALPISTEPEIDVNEMSASTVISTPAIDRVGDVLVPTGILLNNYKRNPVVHWNHGMWEAAVPIGRCEHGDGQVALEISDEGIKGKCYFSQKTAMAHQIFALIEERIVRAASVYENPVVSQIKRLEGGEPFLLVEQWELLEWSFVDIGMNPEAVMKALSRNRLGGEPILEPIAKSLKAHVPNAKVQGIGISTEDVPMADEREDEVVESEAKMEGVDEETTEESPPDETKEAPAEEEVVDAEEKMDDMSEDELEKRFGAKLLSAVHTSLKELEGNMSASLGELENEAVRAVVESVGERVSEMLAEVEGSHEENYGKALKMEEESVPDEEAMKSWVASGIGHGVRLRGVGSRLKTIAAAKNVTSQQRKTLLDAHRQLLRIQSEAKRHTKSAEQKEVERLKGELSEIKDILKQAAPYESVLA